MTQAERAPEPLVAQVREALAIIEGGTDYERLHVASILRNGLAAEAARPVRVGEEAGDESVIEAWVRETAEFDLGEGTPIRVFASKDDEHHPLRVVMTFYYD